MHLAVYLPLLFPGVAALAAGPLAARLEPCLATWLLTVAGLVLAAAGTAVLGLLTVAGLLRLPLVAALKGLSPSAVAHEDPTALAVALPAAALLAVAGFATVRMIGRRTRDLWTTALDAACLPGSDPLVITEQTGADAYAMPGLPGRIVVSTGMLTALTAAEQEVLLAHERAHLRGHHYAFTSLAQLAAAANPLLRPLASAVAYTVERWADEHAATAVGDRHRVARTVGKAALAAKRTRPTRRMSTAALGLIGRHQRKTPGPVPRRVAALLAPPPTSPAVLLLAAAALLAATGLCVLEAVHDFHAFVDLAKTHRS